jgi:hypothetical protein
MHLRRGLYVFQSPGLHGSIACATVSQTPRVASSLVENTAAGKEDGSRGPGSMAPIFVSFGRFVCEYGIVGGFMRV